MMPLWRHNLVGSGYREELPEEVSTETRCLCAWEAEGDSQKPRSTTFVDGNERNVEGGL